MSGETILIAGAGLAGLSTALHLGDRPYRLIEGEAEVGGLCRSVRTDGFTFDFTGHLLHIRRPEVRELVDSLLGPDAFIRIDRRSGIYSHGVYTEYPFQANTYGLPRAVVRECVMGFAETLQHPAALDADPSFRRWALATFGAGITRHFMFPYNEKLFRVDLEEMTADWVSWSIPKPSWADVVRGALGTNRKAFGYNPSFLYPAAGGIDALPRAFLSRVRPPELSTRLVSVSTAKREAVLSTGERVRFSSLVTTLPLPALLRLCGDLPPQFREAGESLRYVSVRNLNLGFDAPALRPEHWIYFPEPRFPFYRVGVYSNLCPRTVPPGHSAYYVEVSARPGEPAPADEVEVCAAALRDVGLVPRGARHVCTRTIEIPYAYIIHDRHRREFLGHAQDRLRELGILSIGRYGNWEYSAMEDAIVHGREAARRIHEEDRAA